MPHEYLPESLTRAELDALPGLQVVQFGTDWCGYCRAAEPVIDQALGGLAMANLLRVEDGKGRPLGRSFHVKLWPTLVFVVDGVEVGRVVRPRKIDEFRDILDAVRQAQH